MRKLYLVIIPILLLASTLLYLFKWMGKLPPESWQVATALWSTMVFFAYSYIFMKGTLRKKRLSILIYLFALLIGVGLSFRLQHWPGGGMSILAGCAGIIIVYLIHFIRRPEKDLLGWMKLLYVEVLMASLILKTINHPYQIYIAWTSVFICLLPIGLFYFDEWKGIDRNPVSRVDISNFGEEIFIYNDNNDERKV